MLDWLPRLRYHSWWILIPVALLCAVGMATIWAVQQAEPKTAIEKPFQRQLIFTAAGIFLMLAMITLNYQRIGWYSYLIYGGCFALLLPLVADRWIDLPFVPFIRGARRWIRVAGVQIQPAELMKIGYVLALAWYLRFRKNYRTMGGLLGPFLLTLVPMVLIKMQPDLGMTLIMLPVLFAMLFVAGAKGRHLLVIIFLGLLCLPLFWLKMEPYQRLRVTAVLLQSDTIRTWLLDHPDLWRRLGPPSVQTDSAAAQQWQLEVKEWEVRKGFQLVRSKAALGSGGATGNGWGQGTFIQYDFLPDRHNDFIFAVIGHQFGIIGCVLVLLCYAVIVLAGFESATVTNDPFGKLLVVGFTVLLATQVITNIGMTLGLAPITGLTLPFVSFGGSSILVSFMTIGLIVSVVQHRPMLIANEPFKFTG